MTTQNLSYTDIDHEFTGEAILIAGLEAEIAQRDTLIDNLAARLVEVTRESAAEIERLQVNVQRLQILMAWVGEEISEGAATAKLKQYGGLSHGRLEARQLKNEAIQAGLKLPFPKPLNITEANND